MTDPTGLAAIAPLAPYVPSYLPINDVTPLTYRDGSTFLQELYGLRDYVNGPFAQWMSTQVNTLGNAFNSEVNTMITTVNTMVTNIEAQVTTDLDTQNTTVNGKIQTLTDYVNAQVASIINASIVLDDTIVKAILENPAATSTVELRAWLAAVQTAANAYADNGDASTLASAKTYADYGIPIPIHGVGIDATGATDSTVAIQAIIDAHPGRRLILPAGVYKIGSLTLSKGQHLTGAGQQDWRDRSSVFGSAGFNNDANFNGTVIRSTIAAGAAITLVDGEVNSGGISNLTILGTGAGNAIGLVVGSDAWTVVNGVIENVKIGNFFIGVQTHLVNESVFTSLMIRGCDTGIDLHAQTIQNVFTMLDIQWCGDGIKIGANCTANTFYSMIAQSCSRTGVTLSGLKNAFYNPYFENNTIRDIDIIAGGYGNLISAPFMNDVNHSVRINAGADYNTMIGFGGYGTHVYVENDAVGTTLQGNFASLVDNGTLTVLLDVGVNGTVFGQPLTFAPVITGPNIGNATVVAKYNEYAHRVSAEILITVGNTTVFNGSLMQLTTPFTPANANFGMPVNVSIFKNGVGWYRGAGIINASGVLYVGYADSTSDVVGITAAAPAALTAGDGISISFTVEIE